MSGGWRSDVVGSLLRPPYLRQSRERGAPPGELRAAEDRAVDEAVALQEAAGLEVVTDGEMRRRSFQAPLVDAVDGFGDVPLEAFLWGAWKGADGVRRVERPPGLGVRGRLVRSRPLVAGEFAYLRGRTTRVPKVSLPSPGLWVNLWSPGVYPTIERFYADIVAILREEIGELAALGARYVQIDAPHYGLLVEESTRRFYAERGCTVEQWVELDNAVMEGFGGMTFGVHV